MNYIDVLNEYLSGTKLEVQVLWNGDRTWSPVEDTFFTDLLDGYKFRKKPKPPKYKVLYGYQNNVFITPMYYEDEAEFDAHYPDSEYKGIKFIQMLHGLKE